MIKPFKIVPVIYPYEREEMISLLMSSLWNNIDYWNKVGKDDYDKLTGVTFSMLTLIDGCQITMPGFRLITSPHPDDEEYDISNGIRPIPANMDITAYDMLHDHFYDYEDKAERIERKDLIDYLWEDVK